MFPHRLKYLATASVAGFIQLFITVPVCANAIAPYAYFWPGMVSANGLSFPASILAAVLERHFFAEAGVRRNTIWYSLQANFISLIAGVVLMVFTMPLFYVIGPLWCPVPIAVSVIVEGCYLRRFALEKHHELRWLLVVFGNLLSSFVLLLLPIIAELISSAQPNLTWKHPALFQDRWYWLIFWGSLGMFGVSFVIPLLRSISIGNSDDSVEVPFQ